MLYKTEDQNAVKMALKRGGEIDFAKDTPKISYIS